ncbi:TonB-dependent receptor [Burkholderia gladioli]|uniref:Yersiniabactin/pesticin receptor FyuA n=1 Tax=Burkholderia gladioli (strain BSR3) TaxID=999541 RepID=F2LSV1_BURGS|nr:TonB-dependent receptor [Burkholderia gladioli]AEA65971.1 yersiniabactin/pesticin receptor FyuA [Burkholderia gladioli BSR3]MBW5286927.1 TonB-dependent receptor [Burkholderia gladioli]
MRYQRVRAARCSRRKLVAISVALGFAQWSTPSLAGPAQQSDPGAAALASPASLPAVTVTASKRDQSLASVNGAAVVVERPALDQAQVTTTQDLARVLSGVQIQPSGSLLFPSISLRGVSSAQDFYNPALTVYVDGVPQLPTFSMQTLLDVDRVELLKGPQGTLYGKSAEGGVLDIVTIAPDNQLRVHADTGVSSRGGNLQQLEVAGPLVKDLLYGSASLSRIDARGDIHNPVTGADHDGGMRSYTGNARLRLAPTGAPWEVNLSASRDCTSATQDIYVPFNDIGSRTAAIAAQLPGQYAQPSMNRCGSSYAVSGRYDFGQWRATAVSAWQQVDFSRSFPFMTYVSNQPERWRQNVQELKLATRAPGRRWDAVFGLYRQDVNQSRLSQYDMVVPAPLNLTTTQSANQSKSLAAYGDVTWHVSSALDLSAGLRASHDQAWTDFGGAVTRDPGAYANFAGANATAGNRVLGKLSAGYQLDSAWRVYANVSQGYKPGGFNLAPTSPADARPFGAERALSYELGTRYEGRAVRGSLALYRVDIHNAQLYTGSALGYQTLSNVGDTRSTGAEFDLDWGLARGWTAGLDGFVNHASFRSYNDPFNCAGCNGNEVPFAPRYGFTAKLSGEFSTAVGKLLPRVALRWLGAQYFDTANQLRQGAYMLLDASLALRPRRDVGITLYAQNLINRDYRSYAFRSPTGDLAQVGLGRTIGVNVSFDY